MEDFFALFGSVMDWFGVVLAMLIYWREIVQKERAIHPLKKKTSKIVLK